MRTVDIHLDTRPTDAPQDGIGSAADNQRFLAYLEKWGHNHDVRTGCITCRRIGHPFTERCSL